LASFEPGDYTSIIIALKQTERGNTHFNFGIWNYFRFNKLYFKNLFGLLNLKAEPFLEFYWVGGLD